MTRPASPQTQSKVAGHKRGKKRGVIIYFDPDQIEEINRHATEYDVSFAEAVRTLVEWGLDT